MNIRRMIAAGLISAGCAAAAYLLFRDYYLSHDCPICKLRMQYDHEYCPWCGYPYAILHMKREVLDKPIDFEVEDR